MDIKKLIKPDKNKITVILLAIIGVALIISSGRLGKEEKKEVTEYTEVGFYTSYLEQRITELCNSIYGISDAKVFLTLDTSSEQVYQNDGASDFLIVTNENGQTAVKLCEIYPKVRGIAVVCNGGDIPRVQKTVTELLSAALGLPTNKIRVAGSG